MMARGMQRCSAALGYPDVFDDDGTGEEEGAVT